MLCAVVEPRFQRTTMLCAVVEPRFQRTRMQCALPQFETALFKTVLFETKTTTEKVNAVILLFRVSTPVQVSASA